MITRIDASAGSGKTYRITRRFLALMRRAAQAYPPPGCDWARPPGDYALAEILAATFTNKAAAEMKGRILFTLKDMALARRAAGFAGGRAERQVEAVLRHYGALNVRTIDSLLNALVRLSALELDLPPDFEPSFDPEDHFTPLYDALMRDLAPDGTGTFGDDPARLRAALAEACRARLFTVESTGFALRGALRRGLYEVFLLHLAGKEAPQADTDFILESVALQKAALDRAVGLLADAIEAEALKPLKNLPVFLEKCLGLAPFELPASATYAHKDSLAECLVKASPEPGEAAEQAYADFRRAYRERAAVLPLLKASAALAPLSVLGAELFRRAAPFWRRERILPAPAVPGLAARLLSGEYGVSDALCRLGSRLTHILLDEFQDTSRDQWAAVAPLALECLSRGGGLYCVGDMKQAIYSWRGGDARLFAELAQDPELTAPAGVRLRRLPCNRRSLPGIVAFNNAAFSLLGEATTARAVLAAMLPDHTPAAYLDRAVTEATEIFAGAAQAMPPGGPATHDDTAANGDPAQNSGPATNGGMVCLYGVAGANPAAVDGLAAGRLERLFREELPGRRAWRDVAVLTRGREEIARLAGQLAGWGVPVVTEESFLPAEHPLVAGVVDLLAFLLYPADDSAFWGSLAIVPGLDPAAAREAVCRALRERGNPRPPLYRLFAEWAPEHRRQLYEPLLRRVGLMSAYDLIMEIVARFRLPLSDPGDGPFLRRLLETAHQAEGRGFSSPPAFLDFWREGCAEDRLPLPEGMDAVRLMTMHAAKGLEFPVVVLPSLHRGRDNSDESAVFVHRGRRLPTKARPELPEIFYPARITSVLEHLNLLYVAFTRPREELHAFVTRPRHGCGPLGRGLEALLPILRERAPAAFRHEEVAAEVLRPMIAPKPAPPAAVPATPVLPPAFAEAEPAARLPRLKIFRSTLESPEFTPRRRGIFAHLCLEHLRLSAPGREEEDVRLAAAQALRLFPLPLEAPEEAARSMAEALLWFVRLPEARQLLERGLREQGMIDESGKRLRVDLLAVEPDLVVALDYKTGRPEPGHEAQVRAYMRLAGAALQLPARGFLAYLDERALLEVTP